MDLSGARVSHYYCASDDYLTDDGDVMTHHSHDRAAGSVSELAKFYRGDRAEILGSARSETSTDIFPVRRPNRCWKTMRRLKNYL